MANLRRIKESRTYYSSIPLDVRRSIKDSYRKVNDEWSDYDVEKHKELKKIRSKVSWLCFIYKIADNPKFIPTLAIRMRRFIKEKCPLYAKERLI